MKRHFSEDGSLEVELQVTDRCNKRDWFQQTECKIGREEKTSWQKLRVVHYINQFFAQIGGEEKADYPAEIRVGEVVGPGTGIYGRVLKMKQRSLQRSSVVTLISMRIWRRQKQTFLQW